MVFFVRKQGFVVHTRQRKCIRRCGRMGTHGLEPLAVTRTRYGYLRK